MFTDCLEGNFYAVLFRPNRHILAGLQDVHRSSEHLMEYHFVVILDTYGVDVLLIDQDHSGALKI